MAKIKPTQDEQLEVNELAQVTIPTAESVTVDVSSMNALQVIDDLVAATRALVLESEKRLGSSNVVVVKARQALAPFLK